MIGAGACLLAALGAIHAAGEARAAGSSVNAVAEALAGAAAGLGIDFYPKDANAPHPGQEQMDAFEASGARKWLEEQLSSGNDRIGPPSKGLAEFLVARSVEIGRVVAILERGTPEWSFDGDGDGPSPQALALIRLDGVLVAAALAAEREGERVEARRLLEASWSIYRGLSKREAVIPRIIATGVMKFQVGALRKFLEPPVEWLDRLQTVDVWKSTLDAFEGEPFDSESPPGAPTADALPDSFPSTHARAVRAWVDAMRRVRPCDVGKMTAEEIARPMREVLERRKAPGEDSEKVAEVFTDIEIPMVIGTLERAGRLTVDSELTAKILELRLERAGSRTHQWPRGLSIPQSRSCPDAVYEYRTTGDGMSIAFKGTVPVPSAGLSLPLAFSSEGAAPSPTPKSAPAATPTPAPAD